MIYLIFGSIIFVLSVLVFEHYITSDKYVTNEDIIILINDDIMPKMKMTYKEAEEVLIQYNEWRLNKSNVKIPRHTKVTEAIVISINVLHDIVNNSSYPNPSIITIENIYRLCEQELKK